MKSCLMSSLAALDGRCFSISATSISSTPALKNGVQLLLLVVSSFSLISFSVNVSSSFSAKEENNRIQYRLLGNNITAWNNISNLSFFLRNNIQGNIHLENANLIFQFSVDVAKCL